jgi:hypothetical protein
MNKKPDWQTKKLFERTLRQQSRRAVHRLPGKTRKEQKNEQKFVDCRKCRYFYVTWEKSTPYGCKAQGFKSAKLPSLVVLASSGSQCLLFSPID